MTHSRQVSARGLLILFVLALCATADQATKNWALTNLTRGQSEPFLPGLIKLTLTTNPGAAFSLGSQNGQTMGAMATVLTLCILGWIVKRVMSTAPLPVVEQIGMGCLLGGALGNLIDRYSRGLVTDFLDFAFMSFPVFNVADAVIDVGIACLFVAMYFHKNEEQAHSNLPNTAADEASNDSVSAAENMPEITTSNQSTKRSD